MTLMQSGVMARAVLRPATDTAPGARCRVMVCESLAAEQVDVTGSVVATIAHALWQARGGDPLTNWVDAERALDALFAPVAAPMPAKQPALAESKPVVSTAVGPQKRPHVRR